MTDNTTSETYSVIVTGEIAAGFELDQVKANIGQRFKLGEAQLNKLFAGKPVALSRGLEKEQALKMRAKLVKAGAQVAVKMARAAVSAKAPAAGSTSTREASSPINCPRCGCEQLQAINCGECGTDLQIHLLRLKRKEKIREFRRHNNA
ncbi:hypothetical protein [Oceanicoccus sp. KOV_DT_Chl]|uniref:hypothetical protein n=1 Tax=Oceanicoccus sp. KOV_DT_Chl TaxID=1904639 RepID=UPI000C7B5869|nr:hypothetical protein [Oceanicoccus sp. KOV_DT_Chl]